MLRVVTVVAVTALQTPTLSDVLAKATSYAADYENRFSVLVAEEQYSQETRSRTQADGGNLSRSNPGGGFTGPRAREERRMLRSDYLLVRLEGGGGWMPFRDVFEADGRKIRDREDRLASLFLKASHGSLEQASRIMAESTRHNIGSVVRTINIPTLAILFLLPEVRPRFEFTREGEETVAGRPAWRLAYREVQRPTLIKTTQPGRDANNPGALSRDLPLRGTMWIDPAAGVILKTNLIAADPLVHSEINVTFREDATLNLWVPAQMDEYYRAANDSRDIVGTATYTNYRRFQAKTNEAIRKPPGR